MPTTDAQRLIDIMNHEGVSEEGIKLIEQIREFTLVMADKARGFIEQGQTLTPVYMFLVKDGDKFGSVMFPVAQLPTKDHIGVAIRMIAQTLKVIAVVNISEAYSLWRTLTLEDVKEIEEKYNGRVSLHPEAKDVAMISLSYNVMGGLEAMSKLILIDESVKPRRIADERDWEYMGGKDCSLVGRMVVPHEMLEPIK